MLGKYILMLLLLGMFSLLYIGLNAAYTKIYSWSGSMITDTDSQRTQTIINILWVYLPMAVIFSYMVYSISQASKEQQVWP